MATSRPGCYVASPRDMTSAAWENGAMATGDGRGRFDLRRLWADDAPDICLGPNDFLVAAAVSDIGRPAPFSEVAATLSAELGAPMRPATLYGTVRKLRRLGLVARTGTLRSPAGGRPQVVLGLTERGVLALEVGTGIARALASAPPPPKAAPSA